MKLLRLSITMTAFLLFASCSKIDKGEISNQKAATEDGISCIDGTLHFASSDVFFETITDLLSPTGDLKNFEKKYGFKSLSSITDEAMDILENIEDNTRLEAALEAYGDIIEDLGEGVLSPKIKGRGYRCVANADGVYFIGEDKYTITPDKLLIESTNPVTKSTSTKSLDYVSCILNEDDIGTKGYEESLQINGMRYETSDRKLFVNVFLSRYVVYNSSYEVTYILEVQMSAQKKVLFTWNSYNTVFNLDELKYAFNVFDGPIPLASFNNTFVISTIVSPETSNVNFISDPSIRYRNLAFIQWPTTSVLRFRARSRGTGNCGPTMDIGRPSIMNPITPCI